MQVIDAAMDSSRYFALRVENPETGVHHFLGIGFAERDIAGQFKLTLSEHGRYMQRMKTAKSQGLTSAAAEEQSEDSPKTDVSPAGTADKPVPGPQHRDLSLKGSIRVNLPNQSEKRGLMAKLNQAVDKPVLQVAVGPSGGHLLPPPPARRPQACPGSKQIRGDAASGAALGASMTKHDSDFSPFPDVPLQLVPEVSGGPEGGSSNDADFGDFCGAD